MSLACMLQARADGFSLEPAARLKFAETREKGWNGKSRAMRGVEGDDGACMFPNLRGCQLDTPRAAYLVLPV